MGINARSPLDPRWSKHHLPVAEGFMTATVKVIRKDPSVPVAYDTATGTYNNPTVEVFTGKARLQPYGIIGDEIVGQDTTGRRLMRIQVAEKDTGIKLDDILTVTECADNPELLNFTFDIRGTIGSNVEWLTDLVAEANMKV